MRTNVIYIFLFLSSFTQSFAQTSINWLSIEEAEAKNKLEPRPFLIDLYTEWCGWCKKLDATTYRDPQIVSFINQNFYAIKFDAETHDTIVFQGQTFVNPSSANRSTHQLAMKFMPERRSYPTTYFMDETMKVNLIVPGYLDSKDMAPFLVYYKEKIYESPSNNINEFRDLFKQTFESTQTTSLNWETMQEALNKNKTDKKKIVVFLNDDATITSKVMKTTSFEDSLVTAYLNENYHVVNFNTQSQETVTIGEQTLVNNPNEGIYHQLVIAGMLKNPIKFPACLFFDESNLLITPVPNYMGPTFLLPVLKYFKEDKYKDTQFADYLNQYNSAKSN